MSAPPLARCLTLAEIEQLPETDGIQELLDGALVQVPPPKRRHSEIRKNVVEIFRRLLPQERIWPETGFAIGEYCPQPDVAVTFPDQGMTRGWFAGSPLLAVEVASRGNTPDELEWKKELYLANGGREVWIVYDKTRTVVVHQPGGRAVTYREAFESSALEAQIVVADLFNG